MVLELHDSDTLDSLFARASKIGFDYQAEMHIQETSRDQSCLSVVKWVLSDEHGVRCVWERPEGSPDLPAVTQRSARFEGEWERGPNEVAIP